MGDTPRLEFPKYTGTKMAKGGRIIACDAEANTHQHPSMEQDLDSLHVFKVHSLWWQLFITFNEGMLLIQCISFGLTGYCCDFLLA
jgi:hypothetical protein